MIGEIIYINIYDSNYLSVIVLAGHNNQDSQTE